MPATGTGAAAAAVAEGPAAVGHHPASATAAAGRWRTIGVLTADGAAIRGGAPRSVWTRARKRTKHTGAFGSGGGGVAEAGASRQTTASVMCECGQEWVAGGGGCGGGTGSAAAAPVAATGRV